MIEDINEAGALVRDLTPSVFPNAMCACIFGSFARSRVLPFSDLDVAILLPQEPELLEIGDLAAGLESASGRNVDIVLLAGLPERNPAFAFRIADEGVCVFQAHHRAFAGFKKQAFLWYLDTEYIRRLGEEALRRRAAAGKLGYRNYVD